jgi:hypothetical protein
MKKILLFAILLAASNYVNATVNYYLTDSNGSSETSLVPSNTVELLFWYTGDPIISFDVAGEVTGPGTVFDGYHIQIPGSSSDFELVGTSEGDPFPTGINNPLATIDFRCDGVGDVTLDLYDITTFDPSWNMIIPVCHGMVIHQVPEPATMVLFSLGGLLLGRRR